MIESNFKEPTRTGRIIDFCFFTLPWFIFGCIGLYNHDPDTYLFFAMSWITMIFDIALENRSTIAQSRKEIAELKQLIEKK